MILPGWISQTKYSGLPLPLPMRTSAGLEEMGLSGNTRIQMRPPRLMWRDMARRAASSWRAVSRPRVVAFRPYSPNDTLAPRVATPVLRPFCCLRYLVLAGCNIDYSFLPSSFTIFFAFFTVVLGAGAAPEASPLRDAAFLSPSGRGRGGPRLPAGRGAGFLARFGSDGASGCATASGAVAGASAACASPFGMISPL